MKFCKICGAALPEQSRAWTCPDCKRVAPTRKLRPKKPRQPRPAQAEQGQCKTCKYRSNDPDYSCNYISVTGQRRNCPQPPNCTKYEKGKRILKKWKLDYSMRGEFE